jgi:hypothetical protein
MAPSISAGALSFLRKFPPLLLTNIATTDAVG